MCCGRLNTTVYTVIEIVKHYMQHQLSTTNYYDVMMVLSKGLHFTSVYTCSTVDSILLSLADN